MSGKIEFREKLGGILKVAENQNNAVTLEEVEQYFEEDHLSQEQIELVCDYLLSQKVSVSGYKKTKGLVIEKTEEQQKLSPEEEAYMAEYLEELRETRMEDTKLLEYLVKTARLAEELCHPEVFAGDLIQEGNVSLMLALPKYRDMEEEEKLIMEEVRQGMHSLIESQTETSLRDKKMVQQVASLDEKIKNLTEEMGRKVSVEEVAEHMGITEEEVLKLLKLAGEDV